MASGPIQFAVRFRLYDAYGFELRQGLSNDDSTCQWWLRRRKQTCWQKYRSRISRCVHWEIQVFIANGPRPQGCRRRCSLTYIFDASHSSLRQRTAATDPACRRQRPNRYRPLQTTDEDNDDGEVWSNPIPILRIRLSAPPRPELASPKRSCFWAPGVDGVSHNQYLPSV